MAVSAPSSATGFQGIGANLIGLSDLNYVPCVTTAAGGCTVAAPNPSVPATSVRAAINLPFTSSPTYYVGATGKCQPTTLTTMGMDSTQPASVLNFFSAYGATPIYASSQCTGASTSMSQVIGTSSTCSKRFGGACFMDSLNQKHVDWVQVFFAAPYDFIVSCGTGCNALTSDLQAMSNLAAFKAGQLVYQGRFGNAPAAPRYVELFNEPEGGWNLQLTPAQYTQMVADFRASLAQLISLRLSDTTITNAERTYLAGLKAAKIVGPGLGSAFKADYVKDPSTPWSTWAASWFASSTDAGSFFGALAASGVTLSTHSYDDKYAPKVGSQLNVLSGMKNLIRVRNQFADNSQIVVTETSATVEADADNQAYQSFCVTHPRQSGSPGACSPAMIGDPPGDLYSYPDCVPGGLYNGAPYGASVNQPIANFCHHQAAVLLRNLANLANQEDQGSASVAGVGAELVWSLTPSRTSSANGLISRSGVSTLMNASVAATMNSFSRDGYKTVFPVAPVDVNSGALLVAPAATNPTTARVVLSNSADVPMTYALNFGNTPFAHFTRVVSAAVTGGAGGAFTGVTESATNPVQASAGQSFGSTASRLVVTLPENSTVTLDLAP